MASSIFLVCRVITNCTKRNSAINNVTAAGLLIPQDPLIQNARGTTSFFMKRTAAELWKSVTSVSNAGRRRGRGKNLPKTKDLNKGQKLGWGKIPIIFPGLNSPIVKGNMIVQQHQVSREEKPVVAAQVAPRVQKRFKVHPLLRGWTGSSVEGRKIGPPDPVEGESFNNFESWVLKHKFVTVMTSNMGRAKACRTMILTGNGNGLAGFASINGVDSKSSLTAAKNRAGQRLIFFPRYNDHTVMHDFYTQFGNTKIYVEQKHKGYGLKCHRVIKTCCEAIGITDLYAKIEGSTNVPHIVKAFCIGLLQQKTHQQIADEKQLHLVELRKESSYFPKVLASPSETRKQSEIHKNELLDFQQYIMNGKIFLKKHKFQPFYMKLPSWSIHLRKLERHRDQFETMIKLKAMNGDICSFYSEKYPEARASKWRKHEKKEEATEV